MHVTSNTTNIQMTHDIHGEIRILYLAKFLDICT